MQSINGYLLRGFFFVFAITVFFLSDKAFSQSEIILATDVFDRRENDKGEAVYITKKLSLESNQKLVFDEPANVHIEELDLGEGSVIDSLGNDLDIFISDEIISDNGVIDVSFDDEYDSGGAWFLQSSSELVAMIAYLQEDREESWFRNNINPSTLDPDILLSDEATSALDPNTTTSILNLLKQINQKLNITIVLVTHEMEVVKQIAQRALLLEHGNIIGFNNTEELFLKPDEKMKKFLGETEVVPHDGINIKIYFPKDNVYQSFITKMARELDMDFDIVWGKLEEINTHIIGNMVINIKKEEKEKVLTYMKEHDIIWEVL